MVTKVIEQSESTNLPSMNFQAEITNEADLKDVTNETGYKNADNNDCLPSITPNFPVNTEDSYEQREFIETEHEKEMRLNLEKRLAQQKEKQMKKKQTKKIMKAFL
jgi:hypothetical protein